MLSDLSYRHQPHHFAQSQFPRQSLLPDSSPPRSRSQCLPRPVPAELESLNDGHHFQPYILSHNKSSRQRSDRQKQQAFPIHSVSSPAHPLVSSTSYSNNGDVSEHMLRRKTPNGTLAAGYDGSPIEWTKRPHAMKHLLMPMPRSSQPSSIPPTLTSPYCENPIVHHGQSFSARAALQKEGGQHTQPVSSKDTLVEDNKVDGSSRRGSIALGGMDSVLNQSSLYYSLNMAGGHTVPTMLQPIWPPCPGPTSIQTPGPFGPYWPNGAFEPYRPAPLRDLRYHSDSWRHSDGLESQTQSLRSTSTRWSQNSDDIAAARGEQPSPAYQQVHNQDEARYFSGLHGSHQGSLPHAFHSKLALGQDRPVNETTTYSSEKGDGLANLADCKEPQSNTIVHAQFKEKVLHWAHRIYCSLLASIEQSRRESHTSGVQANASSLYAQPPRRPYPSWSIKHSLSTSNSNPHQPSEGKSSPGFGCSSPDLASHFENGISQRRARLCSDPPPRTGSGYNRSLDMESSQQPWVSRNKQPRPYQHLAHPSYVPPQLTQDHYSNSPIAAAANAMEILSRLCQESRWRWSDGMLLNGCLAYGLGDYSKATKWYLKVLHQDPDNVEAMSNLAATFLSLGRRHEAEQYWLRSIKLRPNYFEAVEHLVGLLHEEHRGREAIRVIEHVELALGNKEGSGSFYYSPHNFLHRRYHSGYAIPPCENGRLLALIHGKGNVLYQSSDNAKAARAFEDAIMIGAGRYQHGIRGLIERILRVFLEQRQRIASTATPEAVQEEPILLPPEAALETARLVFPPHGDLPGLQEVPQGIGQKAAISIVSNSLLSLAKIYQDGMSSSGASATAPRATSGVQEILALYYLSLSLQPSPSTANNVGILLAGVQQSARASHQVASGKNQNMAFPGVTPGSGIALALAYYDYGLKLDANHAHLYTNLGSLFKDIGQLSAAIRMYEKAVDCDGNFDIALANLANAVKDKGNIKDAIQYYRRAVASNPDFAEAVCGLANALNSVCSWSGRGGIGHNQGNRDRWHVDEQGILYDSKNCSTSGSGWIERVVAIVDKQLRDGRSWGTGVLRSIGIEHMVSQLKDSGIRSIERDVLRQALKTWADDNWEGAKVVRLVERITKNMGWQVYQEKYLHRSGRSLSRMRPQLPPALAVPSAPTVLPFHTFTCPLSAKHIRKISQRNGLRVSCSTLRAPWLSTHIYEPPPPPCPHLNVGYISSDFNNHPLAHLMQSVFGLHDTSRFKAICYATTASDGSVHRQQIERESPVFHDASSWSTEHLVKQIVSDSIHVLVNLNGYTRGAKNEVFAARPAPIQMSFMGFAGTLGAEWCDYLLADKIAIPQKTLRPYRRNVDLEDQTKDGNNDDNVDDWVYGENIIFTRDTFFCCDHKQSAPDAQEKQLSWLDEQSRRWRMRKDMFPDLPEDAVILGNFNQLYKVLFKSMANVNAIR